MSHEKFVIQEKTDDEIRRFVKKLERRSSKSLEATEKIQRDCEEKIRTLKSELSVELLAKANEPVNRAVGVLTFIMALVVVGGGALAWLTTSNLLSTMQSLMASKIDSWMSLDDKHSEASKVLDAYRTRALLDSYMIQVARAKSDQRPVTDLSFKISDKERLMMIVSSSSSSRQDFYDALRLLAIADGEWGILAEESESGRNLAGLVEDPHFDSMRKLDILQVHSRNPNLINVEAEYLQNASAPDALRYQSYLNLKSASKGSVLAQLALKYAIGLLQSTTQYKVEVALKHIAEVDPFNAELLAFLNTLSKRQRDLRIAYRLAVAEGLINQLPLPGVESFDVIEDAESVDRGAIRAAAADVISDLLDDGLRLELEKMLRARPFLAVNYIQTSGTSVTMQFPLERLLGDEQLMQEIYERQYPKGLVNFARFFSVVDRGEVIVLAKLEVPLESLGIAHDALLPKDIVGRLQFVDGAKPRFSWRDSLGDWQSSNLETLSKAKVIMVFDKDAISYRDRNSTDWIF